MLSEPYKFTIHEPLDDPIYGRVDLFYSDLYCVRRRMLQQSGVIHLIINHRDGLPIDQWWTKQLIKKGVGYADEWAAELFPPDAKIVDLGNVYHLWIMLDENPFPFAFQFGSSIKNIREMRPVYVQEKENQNGL